MICEPAALVHRGDGVEAVHCAAVAVVDRDGHLTHYLGDPAHPWMARSSVKPFQVLPLLLSGGFDRFDFDDRQLALMCASHNGTDEHRAVAASILAQAGNRPEDLQCGTHLPFFMRLSGEYPAGGEDRDPLRHNCSGKHAGFLALARHLGEPVSEYLAPDGRVQRMVKQAVADLCRYPAEKMATGIDGCSAPVFALPLVNLAIGFMRLATGQADDSAVRTALDRVRAAMQAHPHLVSGEKRFDFDLMRALSGNIVCKIGAEAIEGIGLADPPIGVAVKVLDGGDRARPPVCVEVLRQLGIIDRPDTHPLLARHYRPIVRNNRDLEAGWIETVFRLKKAL